MLLDNTPPPRRVVASLRHVLSVNSQLALGATAQNYMGLKYMLQHMYLHKLSSVIIERT